MLKLKLLGTPTIHLDHKPISLKTNKSQALLIYLAVEQGTHRRDALATLLWAEMSNQQARKNLRDSLAQLRAVVGDYLLVDPHNLAFNRQLPSTIDVKDFVAQVTHSREIGDQALMEQAFELYQADFLAGFQLSKTQLFDQWAMQKREELHNFAVTQLQWLATQYYQAAASAEGLRITQRLLTLEPWQEAFHLLQMRLLAQSGNRVAALRQFTLCQQIMADELAVPPSAAAVTLYEQIRDGIHLSTTAVADENGDRGDQPITLRRRNKVSTEKPTTAVPATPHNLTRQLTSLTGRAQEIAAIIKLIDAGTPLVTITGEGGIGKSRLAVAVAEALYNQPTAHSNSPLNDGIWFVPLADIVATGIPKAVLRERIAARIGEVLQLSFTGTTKLSSQLESYLRPRRLLLILDNFEPHLSLTDFVAALLHNAAGVQILATSRQMLGLSTEQVVALQGLAAPASVPHAAAWAELLHYDAVALFCEQARHLQHDFGLNQDNAAAVVRICNMVGGSPLGLLLATSLLDLYSCDQIATLLAQDYLTLSGEQLDLPPRQRSMANILDASWQLLAPPLAKVMACCSLLYGPFSMAAAQAVGAATVSEIHSLVQLGWLHHDAQQNHFTLHDRLRQYAAQKLAAQTTLAQAAHRRCTIFYLERLQAYATVIRHDLAAFEMLRAEWRNLHMAWTAAVEQDRLDLVAGAAEGMATLYRQAGLFADGAATFASAIAQVRTVLAQTGDAAIQPILAHLLVCSSEFAHYMMQPHTLEAIATEALTLGRQLADPRSEGLAYNDLARVLYMRGDLKSMAQYAQEACILVRKGNDPWALAKCLNTLGTVWMGLDNSNKLVETFSEALQLLEQAPDYELAARIHFNLGLHYQRQLCYVPAQDHLRQSMALATRFKLQRAMGLAQIILGNLAVDLGNYSQAQTHYNEALLIFAYVDDPFWQKWLYLSDGHLAHLCGDAVKARRQYALAFKADETAKLPLFEHLQALLIGNLLLEEGDHVAARSYYQRALELQTTHNLPGSQTEALTGLASVALAEGDQLTAKQQIDQALAQLTSYENFQNYYRCITILQAMGDPRVQSLLATVRQTIDTRAARINEEKLRHTFYNQPSVSAILELASRSCEIKVRASGTPDRF